MNKATKGALAAGAAVVLLLGGAGSFALWQDSADVDAEDISTGVLRLTPVGEGRWVDISPTGPRTNPVTIGTFNMVPEDLLEYSADFRVDAEGDNLLATVTPDLASIDLPENGSVTADMVTLATTIETAGGVVPTLTEANDGDLVTVVVQIGFDADGIAGQDGTIGLDQFQVVLQQIRETPVDPED
ncbi:alternate-type signal peptide domain-containing protein [Rhodococcus fascians]|uniref:alternate-type signal peptide domain-containing protein n=1 Tax=Rhodococcus sp. JG-3 TaxID=1305835 RepID=UPI000415D8BF|nr:alternate-type signal peptide domain-containing protein [Rhodococcus sp. JG-3]MBY3989812.1 alternate-type signal peptide domain-containing protein [Rhodococcus fascians]MBY3999735.1 alternate-type signal peptide domain-containing protein [Rhodococcus fascians]MBY4001914.1 alternate-type signal peptide domain-containing protein [Rhodococcus fascians]MBY4010290.1 alternate-type signal peptide domain-containing protein [Rhodococcus fascians]MBY4016189.1 alternate-type signal peptide domain-con